MRIPANQDVRYTTLGAANVRIIRSKGGKK
jgi:hypothetical protein